MTVVCLSTVPAKLKGFLTKYLWEVNTGVYVGKLNARVRELVWQRIQENKGLGSATMVFPSNNEQGFTFHSTDSQYIPIDYDGLLLVKHLTRSVPETVGTRSRETSYVVLDLETTGLDYNHDHILEIGAIRYIDGEPSEQYVRLIQCSAVPEEITKLTGITQEMSDKGVDLCTAIKGLADFIKNDVVLGFNILGFDLKFLAKESQRLGVDSPVKKAVDILHVVRRYLPVQPSYTLQALASGILSEDIRQTHRAVDDCRLCHVLLEACIAKGYRLPTG